jgi:hypothetical protein
MSNRVYDLLKFLALIALPAIAAFYVGLAQLWGWPNGELIGATIMLVDTLLGALLQVSSANYKKEEAAKQVSSPIK